jgi:hypothetical protein
MIVVAVLFWSSSWPGAAEGMVVAMDGIGERDTIPPPSKDRRWDIDERGDGVTDAAAESARIERLRAHAQRSLWIAEQPDVHLWPHIERAIAAPGSPWSGVDWSIDRDGRLIVDLVHPPIEGDRQRAALQAEVLKLLGYVIESSTYVEIEERHDEEALVVDVVTGVLDDQSPFKAHGHVVRFRVSIR